MALNLVKLCVGSESIESLAEWQAEKCTTLSIEKGYSLPFHTTRMVPKRADELLSGGSLYWVIKGFVRVRQRLAGIEIFKGEDGIRRCDLMLDHELVPVVPQPRRPFQGWRYLTATDAPLDLTGLSEDGAGFDAFPPQLQEDLAELGLL